MIKIYVLIIALFLYLAVSKIYANDPFQGGNFCTGAQSTKPALAGNRSIMLQPHFNRTNQLSIVNPDVMSDVTIASGIFRSAAVIKGIRTTTRILDALNNSFVKPEASIVLNLAGKRSSNQGVAIGIADFINSLSRITAKYSFSRNCSFYTKFILTSRTANIGLNF